MRPLDGQVADLRSVDALASTNRLRVTVSPAHQAGAQAALQEFHPVVEGLGVLTMDDVTGEQVGAALARAGLFASSIEHERDSLEEIYLAAMSEEKVAG